MDHQRLTALRRYDDPRTGIWEAFAERTLGPSGAFALLSGPLAETRSRGWVICPTVGPEHGNVRRLEAIVARRLSAAGSTALRIRPDAFPGQGVLREIEFTARQREVEDAIELLSHQPGVESVGLVGTLLGAVLAASACQQFSLPAMALVEPVVDGGQYMRDALRREQVAGLMANAEAPSETGSASPMDELTTTGSTTIRGLRLSGAEFDRISGLDLIADLESFSGRSLLVGISPNGSLPPTLRRLHGHLSSLGGNVAIELIEQPLETPFGDYYYRNVGLVRIDTRLELDQAIGEVTAAWALESAATVAAEAA